MMMEIHIINNPGRAGTVQFVHVEILALLEAAYIKMLWITSVVKSHVKFTS